MYLGDFAAGETVDFKWNTTAVGTGSITRATNGSIRIYKNESVTQRSSANGITDTEDFDSLTGLHHLTIDLSDNTDAGFYAAGNDYSVVIQGMVVDGETFNAVIAHFSIENRRFLTAAAVNAEVDTALADYDGPTNAEMVARTLASADYATAAALATVDQNVDDVLVDTGTTLPATLSTIAGYIDTEITTLQMTADNIETDTQDIQTTLSALSIPTANENADALLDRADAIETGLTPRGALRLNTAALAGKVSGAGTGTETFRNAVADSKDRIVSTVDGDGNRTAVTTDAT